MAVHEVGTARMGNDPKKFVLDPFNQAHDVKNLLVTDGSCYRVLGMPESDSDHDGDHGPGLRPFDRPFSPQ